MENVESEQGTPESLNPIIPEPEPAVSKLVTTAEDNISQKLQAKEALETVSVFIFFEEKKISLETKILDSKWETILSINQVVFPAVQHAESIATIESKRDEIFSKILSAEFDINRRKSLKIVYDLINAATTEQARLSQLVENQRAAKHTAVAEEFELARQEMVKRKNKRTNEIVELYDILANKDGINTVEEIEAAKVSIKNMMMREFWSVEGLNEKTGNPGHLSLKKLPISNYIAKAFNLIRHGCRNWWYDWENAFYTYDSEDLLIQKEIADIMEVVGDDYYHYNGNSISDKAQIIDHASMKRVSIENPFNKCKNVINAKNGVLKLDYENHKVELVGKRPEYMFSYCIDTVYDPTADPTPIHNMLTEIVGADQVEYIYQMAAIAIRDTDPTLDPSKIAYLFIGPKNAGKNAVLRLLSDFCGARNVSNIPLNQLAENKFVKPLLEGKLLNTDDELPRSLPINESREIKSLTGGKRHTLEPKNVKPYTGIITALLVFAGNQFPRCGISRDDSAFWDRWEIINFERQFQVREGYTSTILTPENLSGFFNKVIEKLFEIHDHGIKRKQGIFDVYSEWMYSSSTVYRFMEEMTVDSNSSCDYSKDFLYMCYNQWCDAREIPKADRCSSISEFGREIIGKCKVKEVRLGDTERSRVYRMFRRYEPFLLMPLPESTHN